MNLKEDVIPVTELKTHTKEVLARVGRTGNPVLVTQNGHSAVVILDVETFQREREKLHILEEIAKGERQILDGHGITHAEVKRKAKSW